MLPTCEEPEGWLSLGAHDLDPAEEGEGDAVSGLGERLDVAAGPGLRVAELSAGEGQHVEVRGAQLPVQLLQSPVVRLRLLAVTRHVYNQRRLHGGDQDRGIVRTLTKTNNTTIKHADLLQFKHSFCPQWLTLTKFWPHLLRQRAER